MDALDCISSTLSLISNQVTRADVTTYSAGGALVNTRLSSDLLLFVHSKKKIKITKRWGCLFFKLSNILDNTSKVEVDPFPKKHNFQQKVWVCFRRR